MDWHRLRFGADVCLRFAWSGDGAGVFYRLDGNPKDTRYGCTERKSSKRVLSVEASSRIAWGSEQTPEDGYGHGGPQQQIKVREFAQGRQTEDRARPAENRFRAGAGHSGSADTRALYVGRSGRHVESSQRRCHAALSGRPRLAIEDCTRLARTDQPGVGAEP